MDNANTVQTHPDPLNRHAWAYTTVPMIGRFALILQTLTFWQHEDRFCWTHVVRLYNGVFLTGTTAGLSCRSCAPLVKSPEYHDTWSFVIRWTNVAVDACDQNIITRPWRLRARWPRKRYVCSLPKPNLTTLASSWLNAHTSI